MIKEWEQEPDRVEFEYLGFPCLILRNPECKNLCGYVALPPGHLWYGKEYMKLDADVHGGLTYSNSCSRDICHQTKVGQSDDVWWLGFDCAHAGDLVPGFLDYRLSPNGNIEISLM